ncbi:MAG: aminopeptidase P N-terminal domain-containing protein [Bacilli bacterium]|nr:aminopeptidase P N-terminal domain-containing protein [Bacilli bacterium]
MNKFEVRRNNLFAQMKNNSLALIYAGSPKIMSEDENYPFVVNKNFFYLTGIKQEESVLMLIKTPGEHLSFLFISECNELKERWTGKRIKPEEARDISGITNIYSCQNFENMLDMTLDPNKHMYGTISTVYLDLSSEIKIAENKSTILFKVELEDKYKNIEVNNIYQQIVNLRLVKSDDEVNDLIEAINNTNTGINDLLLHMHVGCFEHELSDRFEYFGKVHGSRELSFETIVGAGINSTVLHHPIKQQTKQINDGELVLFDLGYKYNGYSADISRTYPANGSFTDKQRKIYEAVLNCNKAIIDMVKPGLSIMQLQEAAIEILKNECVRLKLIEKDDDIKRYYIHNVSHFLGLDTHDVGDRTQPLTKGNVITVEPGLYFVDDEIGVRIEDNVLVTDEGSLCLSKNIVKEIADVEALLRSKKSF